MRERPIIFSGPMVRAILAGSKTQTRRVAILVNDIVRNHSATRVVATKSGWSISRDAMHTHGIREQFNVTCPYGVPGDRLWVRETWWHHKAQYIEQAGFVGGTITRLEDGSPCQFHAVDSFDPAAHSIWKKRPSIHMPRWASRLLLEVKSIRVERVNEISESDALAEGCTTRTYVDGRGVEPATLSFRYLWDSINEKRGFGWSANPWVWVVEFERIP